MRRRPAKTYAKRFNENGRFESRISSKKDTEIVLTELPGLFQIYGGYRTRRSVAKSTASPVLKQLYPARLEGALKRS